MTLKPTDADRERARELYPMKAACQLLEQNAYLRGYLAAKAEDAEAVRKLPRFDQVMEYDGGIELKPDGDYIAYQPVIDAILAGRETEQ